MKRLKTLGDAQHAGFMVIATALASAVLLTHLSAQSAWSAVVQDPSKEACCDEAKDCIGVEPVGSCPAGTKGKGGGTICGSFDICFREACCLKNTKGAIVCKNLLESDCLKNGGTYGGAESNCAEFVCEGGTEACCTAKGCVDEQVGFFPFGSTPKGAGASCLQKGVCLVTEACCTAKSCVDRQVGF